MFSTNNFTKKPIYKELGTDGIAYFQSILDANEIITDPTELTPYNIDWTKTFTGNSKAVVKPSTTEKISKILKYCNDKKLSIVPQGGNTGLSGGAIPVSDELILSLSNLNKIYKFDVNTSVLSCDAGCILDDLNAYIGNQGYEIPLGLGSKKRCQIGGNIATHAGGLHFIKYGPLRANVLGLEVVTANGDIMDFSSEIRKDNTGFDLKQIFIGSEGTLGIITKANIRCVKVDPFRKVMLIKCSSYEEIININTIARENLGKNLSAIEFFDKFAYESVIKYVPGVTAPFPKTNNDNDYYVLIEIAGTQPLESMESHFREALEKQIDLQNIVLCKNEDEVSNIWKLRASIGPASQAMGPVIIYDFSVDITKWMELVDDVRVRMKGVAYVVGFGHIGDSNLHIDVVLKDKKDYDKVISMLEPYAFEWLQKHNGSLSAEHGIGRRKAEYLPLAKDENVLKQMKQIKILFDPNSILNPYKVFPNA